jgi:hypothetical protein
MQSAETLFAIYEGRGRHGKLLEGVYRHLFNPGLYLRAYYRLAKNEGAMTRGATEETVDAMSAEKIRGIIESLRNERYRWTPVRRVLIPKGGGRFRPLGIPTWSDKLLQEVLRSLMSAYFEPQFSDNSHGFRTGRGCHTALRDVYRFWTGAKWFIEGDIKGCYDNIDHSVLMSILSAKILDGRFLSLVEDLLTAGYMEEWKYRPTLSGAPQGGILTPPTMLRTTLLGAPFKRGGADPIHDTDLLLVDLDPLHQGPDDLPSRVPIRLLQPLRDAAGERLQLADHQP